MVTILPQIYELPMSGYSVVATRSLFCTRKRRGTRAVGESGMKGIRYVFQAKNLSEMCLLGLP